MRINIPMIMKIDTCPFFDIGFYLIILNQTKPEIQLPENIQPIKTYIDECIEKTAEDAIVNNALQGGYYNLPEKSTEIYLINTPYYFHELENLAPNINTLQTQLSLYVNNKLKECINLEEFQNQGFNITLNNVSSEAFIRTDSVLFNLDFPIKITKDSTTTITKFSTTIKNIRLLKIHKTAVEITNLQSTDPYSLCLSCLADLTTKEGLILDTLEQEDNSLLFSITDLNSLIDDELLEFQFSNKYLKYNCNNLPSTLPESMLKSKMIKCLE